MKPDRFEILVCLSGIVGVALITTAAFGVAASEPRVDPVSHGGNPSPAAFASAPPARPNNLFAGPSFIRPGRESILLVQPSAPADDQQLLSYGSSKQSFR